MALEKCVARTNALFNPFSINEDKSFKSINRQTVVLYTAVASAAVLFGFLALANQSLLHKMTNPANMGIYKIAFITGAAFLGAVVVLKTARYFAERFKEDDVNNTAYENEYVANHDVDDEATVSFWDRNFNAANGQYTSYSMNHRVTVAALTAVALATAFVGFLAFANPSTLHNMITTNLNTYKIVFIASAAFIGAGIVWKVGKNLFCKQCECPKAVEQTPPSGGQPGPASGQAGPQSGQPGPLQGAQGGQPGPLSQQLLITPPQQQGGAAPNPPAGAPPLPPPPVNSGNGQPVTNDDGQDDQGDVDGSGDMQAPPAHHHQPHAHYADNESDEKGNNNDQAV